MDNVDENNEELDSLVKRYLEDMKDMALFKKTAYLFDTLWYETGIPDFSASFVRGAMNSVYPKKEMSDSDLYNTLYILLTIGKDSPYIEAQAVVKTIDTILLPLAREEEQSWLEYQLSIL